MKIGVFIKQVANVQSVRINGKTGEPALDATPVMNSSDAHALSLAINVKEQTTGEVTAVGLGPVSAREQLVQALATGADSAIHLVCEDTQRADSLSTAKALAETVRPERFDVLIAGHKADDYGSGQVGIQIAEELGLRHVSWVTEVTVEGNALRITRNADGFPEAFDVEPPVMFILASCDEAPKRHASLRGLMQAKRKPLRKVGIGAGLTGQLTWSEPRAQRVSADRVLIQGEPAEDAAEKLAAWLLEHRLAGSS